MGKLNMFVNALQRRTFLFCVFKKQNIILKKLKICFCVITFIYILLFEYTSSTFPCRQNCSGRRKPGRWARGDLRFKNFLGYLPDQGDLRFKKIYDIFQTHTGK